MAGVPIPVVTWRKPVVAPVGTVAVIDVADTMVGASAGVALNMHLGRAAEVRSGDDHDRADRHRSSVRIAEIVGPVAAVTVKLSAHDIRRRPSVFVTMTRRRRTGRSAHGTEVVIVVSLTSDERGLARPSDRHARPFGRGEVRSR